MKQEKMDGWTDGRMDGCFCWYIQVYIPALSHPSVFFPELTIQHAVKVRVAPRPGSCSRPRPTQTSHPVSGARSQTERAERPEADQPAPAGPTRSPEPSVARPIPTFKLLSRYSERRVYTPGAPVYASRPPNYIIP